MNKHSNVFLHKFLVINLDKLAYPGNAKTFVKFFDVTKTLMKNDWPIYLS